LYSRGSITACSIEQIPDESNLYFRNVRCKISPRRNSWIRRFSFFHDKLHPQETGSAEIEAFLTHLAVERQVAASTQNQALNALVFLYREVLRKDLDGPIEPLRGKRPRRLPTVLTKQEALTILMKR
jgi:site-specific recombinase XerD